MEVRSLSYVSQAKIERKQLLISRARARIENIRKTKIYTWNILKFIREELESIRRLEGEIKSIQH